MRYAEPIERLIKAFGSLPGVGEKTATRLAMFVLNSRVGFAEELASSILAVKGRISTCSTCMAFADSDPCRVCSDEGRDKAMVCVVSDFKDMMAIEAAGSYRGRYHVLHGNLAPLKGVGPDEIRIGELVGRVEAGGVSEVILATGFDAEGEATAMYLTRLLKPMPVRVTRIAAGVPMGGYVEYMDGATLGRAMDGRRDIIKD